MSPVKKYFLPLKSRMGLFGLFGFIVVSFHNLGPAGDDFSFLIESHLFFTGFQIHQFK